MSYASYNRLRAGIESPQYSISQPVTPTAIDLRGLTQPARGKAVATGNAVASPLAGLSEITDQVLKAAAGPRKQQAQKPGEQQGTGQPDYEDSPRAAHQKATLDSFIAQSESTSATGPTARHAYATPRGELVTATRNSRSAPAMDPFDSRFSSDPTE